MADISRVVEIIFQGDDRLGSTITAIGSGLDTMSSKLSSVTAPLADMADKALMMEAAFAALAVGGMALAVKTAGDFRDSFAEISTLIDAPAESINKFSQDILDYSTKSTASIESINSAVYNAISAGAQYSESLDLISQAEKLNVAGKGDLDSTTKLLISTMNAYGASTDEAQSYSDALFKTVKEGQTTLPELSASLAQVTGVASSAGVGIDQLLAAIAAMTASGAPTSQAITMIKAALTSMVKPSSDAQVAASELGIQFGVSEIKSKGFSTVLKEIYDAADGDVTIMGRLFGSVEGLNAALVLGADTSGRYASALTAMENKAGATEIAFQKMADNISLQTQTLFNNLQALLIGIGTPLLDETTEIVKSISEIFKGISIGLDAGAFQPIFDLLESFGKDVAEFLQGVATAMPDALADLDFTAFVNSIQSLAREAVDLFDAFFGDLDLTKSEDLALFFQKFVDGFTALNNVVSGIMSAWEPFVSALSATIDKFSGSGEEAQKFAGQILGAAQAIDAIINNLGVVTGALQLMGGAMSVIAGTNIVSMITGFTGLAGAAGSVAVALAPVGAAIAALGAGIGLGTLINQIPGVVEFGNSVAETADKIFNFTGTQDLAILKTSEQTQEMGRLAVEFVRLQESLGALPEQQTVEVNVLGPEDTIGEFATILAQIEALPAEKIIDVAPKFDEPAADIVGERVGNLMVEIGDDPDDPIKILQVQPKTDAAATQKVKDDVATIPSEKIIAIQLQGDIDIQLAQIKAQAETIQTALEWKAKVDIADIEAQAEIITGLSANISEMFINTGQVISESLGLLVGLQGGEFFQIESIIREELAIRKDLATAEIALANAQTDYMKARTEAMQAGGEALIQIEGGGIEPELEMIMYKILEKIQIKASQEGLEFLIGV